MYLSFYLSKNLHFARLDRCCLLWIMPEVADLIKLLLFSWIIIIMIRNMYRNKEILELRDGLVWLERL